MMKSRNSGEEVSVAKLSYGNTENKRGEVPKVCVLDSKGKGRAGHTQFPVKIPPYGNHSEYRSPKQLTQIK